jgi:hypothetical protein
MTKRIGEFLIRIGAMNRGQGEKVLLIQEVGDVQRYEEIA